MLYEQLMKAWDNKDADGFLSLHHNEFEWYFHSNGRIIKKSNWSKQSVLNWMNRTTVKKSRCIYENDEVHIRHGVAEFESGEREAVMTVVLKKDGLLWRMETGATPLKINKC